MQDLLFLSLNSLIGFVSDIVLNHLSNYKILKGCHVGVEDKIWPIQADHDAAVQIWQLPGRRFWFYRHCSFSFSPLKDDLESENARLKEQRTCKICMDGEVGVVFLPCGHLCSCVLCAPSLRDCPVCRTNIQGTVRTFLSWNTDAEK